ncbi:MAG: hypothetical protein HYV07_29540 [Deltaproteobacteria bacterium]|nr:hypothetical protein [Deltaproteobacteria bacterium]
MGPRFRALCSQSFKTVATPPALALLLGLLACSDPSTSGDAGAPDTTADVHEDAQPRPDADARADGSTGLDAREPFDTGPASDAGELPGDDCIPTPRAGRQTYECGGLEFDLNVPARCFAGGCGLIMDVHGFSMSGIMEENNTGLAALGEARGFIVIQPNANGPRYATSWSEADDPQVFDFLQRVERIFSVDSRKVHMTGFSQGGYMSWRFVCAHSDHLASVAVAAGASNCPAGAGFGGGLVVPACSYSGSEVPSEAIPVLYMHGRNDTNYVPFSCAEPQVDAVRAHLGLTESVEVASDASHEWMRYTSTASNSPALLETLFHEYSSDEAVPFVDASRLLGHCIPGSTDPGGESGQIFSFKCQQASAFVWGEVTLDFFEAHPRR